MLIGGDTGEFFPATAGVSTALLWWGVESAGAAGGGVNTLLGPERTSPVVVVVLDGRLRLAQYWPRELFRWGLVVRGGVWVVVC